MNKVSEYNRYLRYKNNELFLEDISLLNVASKFYTPLYCYSISQMEDNYRNLKNSFKKIKPLICYALKANFNREIIRTFSSLGLGVDVVSSGELKKSLSNGFDRSKIVFSGVGKTTQEIEIAIKKRIKQINVESIEELEEINYLCKKLSRKINICLRVNPNIDAGTHEKISTGRSEDKFGIPDENIQSIFEKYKENKLINIIGLSIHIGSQIETLEPFKKAFKRIKGIVLNLRNLGFKVCCLDLGGGVGIRYNQKSKIINIKSYVKLIEEIFSNLGLEIILEPGRYLVGSSGIIVSRVIRVKEGIDKDFTIIDAGMDNLIRPALYGAIHKIIPVKRLNNKKNKPCDIVGPICETSDIFINKFKDHSFQRHDLVAILSTGAYSSCMASRYNLREKANEIFIKKKKINISNK